MKATLMVLLALVAVASPARAVTLEITSGTITEIFNGPAVVAATLLGPGFTATMEDDLHISFFGSPTGVISFSHLADIGFLDQRALITVGAESCGGFTDYHTNTYDCGVLFIAGAPLPEPRVLGTSVTGLPFTASGHFNVGPGYDVIGQGFVTATYRDRTDFPDLSFTFAVPEPSTLALGLGGLVVLLLAARRRARE